MMTRRKRMVMVDAWLRGSQTLADYTDTLGVDVCTFLGWIVDYGQPAYSAGWVPVRILDGGADGVPLDEVILGGGPKPVIWPSCEFRQVWIPVFIQESA
jgi:hypothetical protein